jgi:hypothetical protein
VSSAVRYLQQSRRGGREAFRPAAILVCWLAGAGITAAAVGVAPARYRHCYTGLRLLLTSGGRFFLLPEHWTPGQAPALVVAESDSVRVEFRLSPSLAACP